MSSLAGVTISIRHHTVPLTSHIPLAMATSTLGKWLTEIDMLHTKDQETMHRMAKEMTYMQLVKMEAVMKASCARLTGLLLSNGVFQCTYSLH